MHSYPINNFISQKQDNLYGTLNSWNKTTGRIFSPFVAIVDVGLQTIKSFFLIIEHIALSAINLIGAAFSQNCTLKHGLKHLQSSIESIFSAAIATVFLPINLIFQTGAIIINPSTVKPFYDNRTFTNLNFEFI